MRSALHLSKFRARFDLAEMDGVVLDPAACSICGSEMCQGHVGDVEVHPDVDRHDDHHDADRHDAPPALAFQPAADLIVEPRPVEIIAGVAFEGRVSVLASESGAGKTFLLLDVAAHVSGDLAWHGRAVSHGSVAYVSFEGDALGLRLQALKEVGGHRLDHVYIVRASAPVSPVIDRERVELPSRGESEIISALDSLTSELATTHKPAIVLVVVDTVRASLSGSEDNSESVSAYLRAVRRIMTHVPGAAVILAHHSGWQDGENKRKRERGSSAFRGNVEATLYLESEDYDAQRGEAQLTLRALKIRDAERPAPLSLIRRRVDLNESNGHGEPVTSCVIDRDRRSREDRDAERQQVVEAEHRDIDLVVLKAMQDYPAATSITRLRAYVGLRTGVVSDAVARILRGGWAVEGKRGQPYTVTEAGLAQLNEGTTT